MGRAIFLFINPNDFGAAPGQIALDRASGCAWVADFPEKLS
jgi:hypothetical protein